MAIKQTREKAISRRSMLGRSLGAAVGTAALGVTVDAQTPSTSAAPARSASGTQLKIRRVVTGHRREDGKSCIISDGVVDASVIWQTSGSEPLGQKRPGEPEFLPSTAPRIDPPPGGNWWRLVAFAPSKDPKPTLQNRIGMHRTATIDYCYVLSGEVTLLLDVEEVKLNAGDVVVQRNTSHAWRIDGDVPAQLLFTLIRVDPKA